MSDKNLFFSPISQLDPYDEMKLRIAELRLSQASQSFKLALFSTAAAACVGLTGAGLLLSGYLPEGSATAAGGLVSSAYCIKFAKDANDRLDKILDELDS